MAKLRILTGIVCLLATMATAQEKNVPRAEPEGQPKTQELGSATYYVKALEGTAKHANGKPFEVMQVFDRPIVTSGGNGS